MPAWAKCSLRPPGPLHNGCVVLFAVTCLIGGGFPGGLFVLLAIGFGGLLLLGVAWAARAMVRVGVTCIYHQPILREPVELRSWLIAPLMAFFTSVAMLFRLPLWVTFLLSVRSLNAEVRALAQSETSSAYSRVGWVGVFPVKSIRATSGTRRVYVTVQFAGSVGDAGFLYSPNEKPVGNGERRFKAMNGGWYAWWDDF